MHNLEDPEYSLKQETTEFLTQLSQSLSDENDNLISLIRTSLSSMREVLGMSTANKHPDSAIGSMGSNENAKRGSDMLHQLPTSYEALAADMDATLLQLKSLLTNPNFASIEEVEVRDEEISRLREGWVRMEHRWKDVLIMMEGWRRKMDTGHSINIDDLRMGIGLVSPENLRMAEQSDESPDQSFVNGDVSEIKLPSGNTDSSVLLEPPRMTDTGRSSPKRKRDILEPPEFFDLRPSNRKHAHNEEDVEALMGASDDADANEEESLPRMTVAEKLDLARAEAEEVAVARASKSKTRASKLPVSMNGHAKGPVASLAMDGAADSEQDDTLGKMPSPIVKKTKIKGRPRRRKSTLSPAELEELIAAEGA
jgi:hypothetical protein